jgi:hypothetical protein
MKNHSSTFNFKDKILFLSILVILSFLANSIHNEINIKNHLEFPNNIDTLIIGDSHVRRLDTNIINNSINIGEAAENYINHYHKFKIYIDRDKIPKRIIIPYDLHSFSSYRLIYTNKELFYSNEIDLIDIIMINYRILHKYNSNRSIRYLKEDVIFNYVGNLYEKGSNNSEKKEINISNHAKKRVENVINNSLSIEPINIKYLNRIIKLANDNNIEIYLLKPPLNKDFINEAEKYMNIEEYYREVGSLIKSNKKLKLLDFQNEFINDDSMFINSDHLNNQGANIISMKIQQIIENEQ